MLYSFLLVETLATYMGISLVGGIVWQRANRWGAASSVIVALAINFSLYHIRNERLDHWNPTVFLIALLAGTPSLIVVSFLTPAERGRQVADAVPFNPSEEALGIRTVILNGELVVESRDAPEQDDPTENK